MPTSKEHCDVCPFALVGEGLEAEELMEQILVHDHILAIVRRERGHRVDLSTTGIAPSRVLAARACAKTIFEQKCTRFVSLGIQRLDEQGDEVLIVERNNDH